MLSCSCSFSCGQLSDVGNRNSIRPPLPYKILINLFGIRYPSSASVIRYPSVPFIIKLGSLAYFESKRFNQLSSTLVGMSIISPLVWIAPPDGA